jgi:hypothetical protein
MDFVWVKLLTSSTIIYGHIRNCKVRRIIDAENLHRGIHDMDSGDAGRDQVMGSEELRLGLPWITSFTIPIESSLAIEVSTRSLRDRDIGAANADKRSWPLLIAEGCFALKDNLGRISQSTP